MPPLPAPSSRVGRWLDGRSRTDRAARSFLPAVCPTRPQAPAALRTRAPVLGALVRDLRSSPLAKYGRAKLGSGEPASAPVVDQEHVGPVVTGLVRPMHRHTRQFGA